MELDELKEMWQKQAAPEEARDLKHILGKRSNTAIARMKRHLFIELWLVVVLYSAISAYFIGAWNGRFYFISILYILTAAAFLVYYYRKMKLLREMECMACQVKSNLAKQVRTLEKYVKTYLIAGTVIVPVFLLFFYWFDYAYVPPGHKHFFVQPSGTVSVWEFAAILIALLVGTTVVFYFLNRWYVRRLYGRYIDKLKQVLEQMDDEDQAF